LVLAAQLDQQVAACDPDVEIVDGDPVALTDHVADAPIEILGKRIEGESLQCRSGHRVSQHRAYSFFFVPLRRTPLSAHARVPYSCAVRPGAPSARTPQTSMN